MFLWLIAAYGMSNILVYGSIFEGYRNTIHSMSNTDIPLITPLFKFLSGLIVCMMCTSTWVGFFYEFVLFTVYVVLRFTSGLWDIL